MSGLCGWIGQDGSVTENLQLARRMAGPLARFDGSVVEAVAGRNSGLAIAASGDNKHIYQKNGLLLALWGRANFLEPRLIQLARAEGVAKTLADDWRERGEKALENLTGAFSLCILDENTDEAILAIDRMGICPLVYRNDGRRLVFGSSADAVNLHSQAKAGYRSAGPVQLSLFPYGARARIRFIRDRNVFCPANT